MGFSALGFTYEPSTTLTQTAACAQHISKYIEKINWIQVWKQQVRGAPRDQDVPLGVLRSRKSSIGRSLFGPDSARQRTQRLFRTKEDASYPRRVFLNHRGGGGGMGVIRGTHPPQNFGKPTDRQMSHPHEGGWGYCTPTHLPNYHRLNALTSAFGADPKSPKMAFLGWLETHPPRHSDNPPPRRVGHTPRKTLYTRQTTAQCRRGGRQPPGAECLAWPSRQKNLVPHANPDGVVVVAARVALAAAAAAACGWTPGAWSPFVRRRRTRQRRFLLLQRG